MTTTLIDRIMAELTAKVNGLPEFERGNTSKEWMLESARTILEKHIPETMVLVERRALERILVLADEVFAAHRDKQGSGYNECDIEGEQCKWCADYLKAKAMTAKEVE